MGCHLSVPVHKQARDAQQCQRSWDPSGQAGWAWAGAVPAQWWGSCGNEAGGLTTLLPFSEGHLVGRGRAGWGEPGQEAPGGARAGPASRVPTCPGSRISGTTSSVSSTVANSPESFKLFTRTRCLGRVCARACALCLHAACLGGRSRGVALTPPPPAGGPGDSQEWEGPAAQQGAWMGGGRPASWAGQWACPRPGRAALSWRLN